MSNSTGPLAGTVALVTGASSGIGAAAAAALAGLGASVAVVARRKDRLEALAGQLGGDVLVLPADITDPAQARDVVAGAVAHFGRLDTLVNNAGVMLIGPIVDAPLPEWDRMIDLNVKALLACTHAALPHLLAAAQDGPRRVADVVNISSVAGRNARAGNGVYALTKFGVGAFSESLRQEVTGRHVRVSLIEPGAVVTELVAQNRPEIQEMVRGQLAAEPMQAQDVAEAIGFVVTRPRHVTINEVLIRPTEQER